MNIISIYNQKGGTGKTSFSALLGKYAASQGEPTLLIDLDPQESLTETFSIKAEKTAFHWLTGQAAIREVVYKISENLFIIPGDIQLIKIH